MAPGNSPYLDLLAFLQRHRAERYRAAVVHGAPLQGKSSFARRLAEVTGGAYVDVLARVVASPDLCRSMDTLDPAFLKRLVLEPFSNTAAPNTAAPELVILDDFDFLIPVWGGSLATFLEMVRRLSAAETPSVALFFMQTRPELDEARLVTSGGGSRVLRFEEIQALP